MEEPHLQGAQSPSGVAEPCPIYTACQHMSLSPRTGRESETAVSPTWYTGTADRGAQFTFAKLTKRSQRLGKQQLPAGPVSWG